MMIDPARQLSIVCSVTEEVLLSEDFDEALGVIAAGIGAAFGFRYVTVCMAEGTNGDFRRKVLVGYPEGFIAERTGELISRTYLAEVLKHAVEIAPNWFYMPAEAAWHGWQRLYVGDTGIDAPRGGASRWHERDGLALKLLDSSGAMIGYVSVDGPADGNIPSIDTLALTRTFVNLVGLAAKVADNQRQLLHQALHDELTGVKNRRAFTAELERALASTEPRAVLFIDVDDFKVLNDTYGHHAGDAVLASIAARLQSAAGAEALVARIGGDEFAVLVSAATSDEVEVLKARLAENVSLPIETPEKQILVVCSIGGTLIREGQTLFDVMRDADLAMYEVKRARHRHLAPSHR